MNDINKESTEYDIAQRITKEGERIARIVSSLLSFARYGGEEEKKLKYGRSNSKTLIDYQNDFFLAAINEYKAILEYYRALIDLENVKDTLLAKVGVLG